MEQGPCSLAAAPAVAALAAAAAAALDPAAVPAAAPAPRGVAQRERVGVVTPGAGVARTQSTALALHQTRGMEQRQWGDHQWLR